MTAEDVDGYRFDKPITDYSIIRCPDCKEAVPLAHWRESEIACEGCGDHFAIKCPRCEERYDYIFDDDVVFQVVIPGSQPKEESTVEK